MITIERAGLVLPAFHRSTHTRSDVKRKQGRDDVNVVAEIQKANELYVHNLKATLAAIYHRRFRVACRAAVSRITSIDGLYIASI